MAHAPQIDAVHQTQQWGRTAVEIFRIINHHPMKFIVLKLREGMPR